MSVITSMRRKSIVLDSVQSKVLRNTYILLSMTVAFSAFIAFLSLRMGAPLISPLITFIAVIGLSMAIQATSRSYWGIILTFALTGLLGYILGPILSIYLSLSNGTEIVGSAMGLTAFIFFSLSGYVLYSGKSFSFMGSFLFAGSMVVIGAFLLMLVLGFFGVNISGLHLALSAVIVLLMSGYILYNTSSILEGGETNYVLATVSLYLNIFNLFIHLLSLLSFFFGRR